MSRPLTWLLCGMTGAFVLQFGAELVSFRPATALTGLLALSRENLFSGQVWTLLTHAFLHSTTNLLHVAGSLAGIYLLGRSLEQTQGTRTLLAVFGSSILAGGLAWLVFAPGAEAPLLGATAGVYGLLAYGALAAPQREWRILFFFAFPLCIRPRQLVAVLATIDAVAFLLIDLLHRPWPFEYAPAPHLGGLLAGWAVFQFRRYRHRQPAADDTAPATPLISAAVATPAAAGGAGRSSAGSSIREQVDGILDKINREGLTALTDEERRTLDNARHLINRR